MRGVEEQIPGLNGARSEEKHSAAFAVASTFKGKRKWAPV